MDRVATFDVDPTTAVVYGEGWQSWSVVQAVPISSVPFRPSDPNSRVIDCQPGVEDLAGAHGGAGLLAVQSEDEVHVFGAVDTSHDVAPIWAHEVDGTVVVRAGGEVTHVVEDGGGGIEVALARWGDLAATRSGLGSGAISTIPPVWCSWYQYFDEVCEQDIIENLDAMDDLGLSIGVVQIDDGYQVAAGDWLESSGRFADLAGLVARIRSHGRRAGIWIAPFVVGRSSRLAAEHPDWLVTDPSGRCPVYAGAVLRDQCSALDVTHPGARGYLDAIFKTLASWGIDYVKIDFAYAGALEGLRHEAVTGVEAYRLGLHAIRGAMGPDATLLGCGAPLLASVGLVDAMRIGPDIALHYEPETGNPSMPSQRAATRNTVARAWQHGRLFVNDPDCLVTRPEMERREQWAATIERYGGLRSSSDRLRSVDAWGLEAIRRLLVPSSARPLVPSHGVPGSGQKGGTS